ncbi:hypothetical protein [Hoeflea marina]|uniref:hypothetical protein n=1 Tax=Hoeflea marina TaxID=274592 RepID=UPI001304C11B|nr:hypothetical protein [Hoeflea marina]
MNHLIPKACRLLKAMVARNRIFVAIALVHLMAICYMQRADAVRLYHVRSWRNW